MLRVKSENSSANISENLLALQYNSPFGFFLFSYFLTLHADRLAFTLFSLTIRWNNLLALGLCLFLVLRLKKQLIPIDKKIAFSLGALFFSLLVSLIFSPFPLRALSFLLWYGVTLCGYFLFPLLLMYYFEVEKIFRFYFASFFLVGLYAAFQLLLSLGGIYDPFAHQMFGDKVVCVRANAFCYEPSYYALYMTPFMVMVNLSYLQGKGTLPYLLVVNSFFLLSTSTSALFAYLIFFSFAYATLLFFPFVRPFSSGLMSKLNRFFLCVLGGFILLSLVFPTLFKLFFFKFFTLDFALHHSFAERWAGIVEGWKIFCERPLLGVGLGGVPSYLMENYLEGKESLYRLVDFPDAVNPLKFFEPTNVLIEILSSLGIIGLGAFVSLIWLYLSRAKKFFQAENISREKKEFAYALLLSWLVMLVLLQFNQGVFRTYVWVHFALSFAFFNNSPKDICAL